MSNFTDSAHSRQVDQVEHSNDASAKRVILKYQNPNDGSWYNFVPPATSGVDYDYIDIQQTDSTTETYVYKLGGSSGSIIQTIVVTYTDSSKNDLDKVEYS